MPELLWQELRRKWELSVVAVWPPWCGWSAGKLSACIFAGKGNNGGDGFVAARHLVGCGIDVAVYVTGALDGISGDARTNLDILRNMGVDVVPLASEEAWSSAASDLARADVAVDAILGTGAKGAPSGEAARAISIMNESHAPIIAVDVPSGVDACNGSIGGDMHYRPYNSHACTAQDRAIDVSRCSLCWTSDSRPHRAAGCVDRFPQD